jgi:hypothetical protein
MAILSPMRIPDDVVLRAWLAHRRREQWLFGGLLLVAGVIAIVSAALVAASGVVDADGVVPPAIMIGILLVAVIPAGQLNRRWQQRRFGLDDDTMKALDLAFGRAILQRRDPRKASPDEAVAILKAALGEASGATAMPDFSDAQLRASFRVQRSLRRAIMVPGLVLAAMSLGNALIDDPQVKGVVSGVGLLGVVLSALLGHLWHRRVRADSGLSDRDLGTMRAAALQVGLFNAAGTDEDVRQLRRALGR